MFSSVFGDKYYCGIDIGSSTIKACLLKREPSDRLEVLGITDIRTLGFRKGMVTELEELTECVQTVVRELENITGCRIRQVCLGINNCLIDVNRITTVIPLTERGHKVITSMDVRKLRRQARLLGVGIDDELLHDIPQVYQIDGTASVVNPLGLYARNLGVSSLIIVSNANRIRNIIKAVNHAGYDVLDVCLSIYVSSEFVLNLQEKKRGCMFIDIGAASTDIMVFKDGILKELVKLPIGGDDFTISIANRFDLSFDLAEQLKISYATAFNVDRHSDEEILIKKEGRYISVKKRELYLAVKDKISPLVDGISCVLEKAREEDRIECGIILVGGGALLSGLIEYIAEETKESVNLGKVRVFSKKLLPNLILFSSAFGLASYASQQASLLKTSSSKGVGLIKETINRIRELYVEYF